MPPRIPGKRPPRARTSRPSDARSSGRRPAPRRRAATPKARPESNLPNPEGERLQKVMASAGVGSRRHCEELITSGRVEVDRRVVTELGTRVDPASQEIRLDGEVLSSARHVYYAVNKPTGVVSTNRDPAGRPRVIDLVPARCAAFYRGTARPKQRRADPGD